MVGVGHSPDPDYKLMLMKIVTIGRSSSNDVNINDSLVSRSHCQIIQDDNGNFRLIDTNSKNGTFINGTKRHGEVWLNTSDIIRIGNTTLPWQTYFNNAVRSDYGGNRTLVGGGGISNSSSNNININYGNNGNNGNNDCYTPSMPKPDNFLVWAILSTLFCCLPFGIISIVYASKVDGLWYAGHYAEAQNAASKARTWFWWSFVTAILVWIAYVVLIVAEVGLSVY